MNRTYYARGRRLAKSGGQGDLRSDRYYFSNHCLVKVDGKEAQFSPLLKGWVLCSSTKISSFLPSRGTDRSGHFPLQFHHSRSFHFNDKNTDGLRQHYITDEGWYLGGWSPSAQKGPPESLISSERNAIYTKRMKLSHNNSHQQQEQPEK